MLDLSAASAAPREPHPKMIGLKQFAYRIRALVHRGRLDADMAEEMRLHLELRAERNRANGIPADDAHFAARRTFGGIEQIKEQARDQCHWRWIEQTHQDVRFALRGLARTPGFTLGAVLTFTLGIGANAGIFSVLEGLLLRPRVDRDPASFVHLAPQYSGRDERVDLPGAISLDDFRAYLSARQSLDVVAGWAIQRVRLGDDAQEQLGLLVTPDFFAVYGLEHAKLGRLFHAAECAVPGAAPVVVLSEELWRQRFAADPEIIGRTLLLNRQPFTVVGVTPARFAGRLRGLGIWLPYTMQPQFRDRQVNLFNATSIPWLQVDGRLKRGYSRQAATAEFAQLAAEQDQRAPGRRTHMTLTNGSLIEEPSQRARFTWVPALIMSASSLVLVLTCVNVTMLLLGRGAARQREITIRLALGASRGRLLRLLLTESVALAAIAGGISAWLAYQVPAVFEKTFTETPNYLLTPNWPVFAYLAGATLLAGIAAGLAPAIESLKIDLVSALKGEERSLGSGQSRWRIRDVLVAVQIAVSTCVLIGAGIFARTQWGIAHSDPGYESQQVLLVRMEKRNGLLEPGRFESSYREVADRVRALNGVAAVCYTNAAPGMTGDLGDGIKVQRPGAAAGSGWQAAISQVTPEFFETVRLPIVLGHAFRASEPTRIVVSETAARTFWPGETALGKLLIGPAGETWEVVGVVRDVKERFGIAEGPRLYLSWNPSAAGYSMLVRYRDGLLPSPVVVQNAFVDSDLDVIGTPLTLQHQLDTLAKRSWVTVRLLLALAAISLLLSLIGIYGVVALAVGQRTREMGIRMALGANRGSILWLVLRSSLRPVWVGLAAGVALAAAGAQASSLLLQALPFPLARRDPAVYAAAALLLLLVVIATLLRPAWRAARVNPMMTLRGE